MTMTKACQCKKAYDYENVYKCKKLCRFYFKKEQDSKIVCESSKVYRCFETRMHSESVMMYFERM